MLPKNKFQRSVIALREQLPAITEKQKRWAYEHCLLHIARLMAKGLVCLDCGCTWPDQNPKAKTGICPGCGRKVRIMRSKKLVFDDCAYLGITTTWRGNQVFRLILLKVKYRTTRKPEYECREVVQRWLGPNGKTATFARSRNSWSVYYDSWCLWSEMELRGNDHIPYSIRPYGIYPSARYIPEIKRNGFKGEYHGLTPFDFFTLILSSTQAETLLKAGEFEWFKVMDSYPKKIAKCWPAIKICLRNKFEVKDKHLWLDYIELLLHFGKDIRSPRYACAKDYHEIHDQLVRRKRREQERKDLAKKIQEAIKEEDGYRKAKGGFFGIEIIEGNIRVKVLESVAEVIKEGDYLHHCVFTNGYHRRPDTLLLSARIEGKPVETIEFSLTHKKVMQCRGEYNKNSEYHDRILSLVSSNSHLIRKRTTA